MFPTRPSWLVIQGLVHDLNVAKQRVPSSGYVNRLGISRLPAPNKREILRYVFLKKPLIKKSKLFIYRIHSYMAKSNQFLLFGREVAKVFSQHRRGRS